MSTSIGPLTEEKVILSIPCLAEYVGIARLAILGIANRLSFSYDEVEDIRLAVGEACGQAIERAGEHAAYLTAQNLTGPLQSLQIVSSISGLKLTVEVTDTVPTSQPAFNGAVDASDFIDYQKLGAVLIEILVDKVSVVENSNGTTIKLEKTAASHGT